MTTVTKKSPKGTFKKAPLAIKKYKAGYQKTVNTAVKVGNVYTCKIAALCAANLGLNEFSFGFPVYIGGLKEVNAGLGDLVQIKVLNLSKRNNSAIAKVVKVLKKSTVGSANTAGVFGTEHSVKIVSKVSMIGQAGTYLASDTTKNGNMSKFVVYAANNKLSVGQTVSVTVTKVTAKYLAAKLVSNSATSITKERTAGTNNGAKITLVLPNRSKRYLKHIVFRVNPSTLGNVLGSAILLQGGGTTLPTIFFVKPMAGIKLDRQKVQIQVVKAYPGTAGGANIVIGKVVDLNPISTTTKNAMIQASVKQMLNSGMHYGEQAVRCNARMKKYVIFSKLRSNSSRQAKPLIKKGRNIINLLKTRRCLNKALSQLTKYAAKGKTFLFVGTKKAASGLIARASLFSKKAFFVNTRWLGGMLTNWKTILKSISKIRPILKEKQVIIKDILSKRQSLKTLLMEKAFLLKKKSKLVLKKGKQLVQKLAKSDISAITDRSNKLIQKRKQLVEKGQALLEKRQLLLQKRKQIIVQSQSLYQKAVSITNNSKELFNRATLLRTKVRELKALLEVSHQLQQVTGRTSKASADTGLYTVSYNQYKSLMANMPNGVIPNPPKEILNKMVLFIKAATSTATSKKQSAAEGAKHKVLVFTKLLNEFSSFAPSIKAAIKLLLANLKEVQAKLVKLQTNLKVIVSKMEAALQVKNNIVSQLRALSQALTTQRNIIRIVKRCAKQISSQKRLIKFLPKLRYLPTPSTKISQTVQVLMKKIVDPKLKYPIDSLYDQKLRTQSKKVAAMRKKKWQRLEKYLGGIANIKAYGFGQIRNNVAIIIGQQEEINAIRECQKLGIKMFHVVDTNCNPGFADHFIPANDDSRNSIKFVLTQFLTRIRLAQKLQKVTLRKSIKA